jgi:Holliday junction DNA helicase RuvA
VIASLKGVLEHKAPDTVIIDVGGVGYAVMIPLSTYYMLPEPGERTSLHIHTTIKDDAIILNGFFSIEEKEIFLHMVSVSGIGPKLARNILSGISVDDFKASVVARDIPPLVKVPGLGKKTAERLILELSDKLAPR